MPSASPAVSASPQSATSSLWRDSDFRRLWIGQTAAQLGEQSSLVILPLIAILGLTPLGSLLGGFFAEQWGLRTAILVTAAGMMLSPALMARSPLVRLGRALPKPRDASADST